MSGFNVLKQPRLLAMKVVAEAARNNRPFETIDGDLAALNRYNKLLLDNLRGTLELLDASNYVDEEDLPVIQIEDLTAEDILKHHISTGVLPEDATVEDLNTEILSAG